MLAIIGVVGTQTNNTDVTLTYRHQNVCPGQAVNFRCTVRGDHATLEWTSDHYIYSRQPLQFSINSPLRQPQRDQRRSDTFAMLINKSGNMLQSILSITPSSNHTSFTVTCTKGTDNQFQTVTVGILRKCSVLFVI